MRTDKKRLLPAILLYLAAAALITALGVTARGAQGGFGPNALLVAGLKSQTGNGVKINSIKDFTEDNQMLATYEIRRQSGAAAARETSGAAVIGTNAAYAGVMGYPFANGGFFTDSAYDAGAREAVLNQLSAEALFGGVNITGSAFRIDGELWSVAGVMIDDGDAENIYVPATSYLISDAVSGQNVSAGALAVLMNTYGAAETAGVKSKLKDLGVGEDAYELLNIGKAAGALNEMSDVAVRFALALSLFLFAWFSARSAYRSFRAAEEPLNRPDALQNPDESPLPGGNKRGLFLKTALFALLFLSFSGAALALAKGIAETCITWQEMPLVFRTAPSGFTGFNGRMTALGNYQLTSFILFVSSAAVSAAAIGAAARAL